MGVAWPLRLPEAPVVSYTTFSPLRFNQRLKSRFVSVALSASRLARVLPGIVSCGVRTFLTLPLMTVLCATTA